MNLIDFRCRKLEWSIINGILRQKINQEMKIIIVIME